MGEKQATTLPRGLIFLASAWLLSSWLVAVGVSPPIHPSSNTYTPAAQVLLASIVLGGVVGWPLMRLSGRVHSRPITQTLLDMVSMYVLLQIVIWPLRLVTTWTIPRIILIDLSISAWLATCGAIVAFGMHTRGFARTLCMTVILAWLIGPLLPAAMETPAGPSIQASPLGSIWTLTGRGGSITEAGNWTWLAIHWCFAMGAWVLAGFLTTSRRFTDVEIPSAGGDPGSEEIA